VKHLFVIFYPLVLLFYAISPDSIWWFQIFTFLSFAFFLGFKLDAKIPKKVLVLIFFLFLSTALSINKVYSVPIFFSYLVILTISLTYSFDGNEIIRKSYIAGTVLMGLFSIIYTLTKIFLGNVPKFLSFLDTNTNLIIPYYGHAFYAIFLVATLPFVLDKFFKEKTFSRYILLIIYLVFILCSFSKTAIIVGSLEIAIYLFVKIKQRIVFSSSRIAIPLLTFLSLSVVVITLVLPKNDWLDQKINKPSIPARLEYWTQDFQIIKNSSPSRLMFGYGLDNFFELSNRFQSKPLYWTKSAHNFFIQFAIENGFIAAVILVFILISALRKNWKRYTLSEKVIAVSLLIYSFGSTYDIGIIIPVMMLFFLILFKKDNNDYSENSLLENANELKINKVFISLAIFVLLLFWSGYIFNFTHFNIFNQSKIQLLDVFPYSSAYWSIVIDKNANDSKKLMSIYDKLQKYSKSNVDLNKNIILKIYKNKDYCDAVNISKDYLESVPFDTEIQRTIMPIITNCPEIVDNNMDNYYMKIKKFYSSVEPDVVGMRGFFNFVASYYYRNDNSDEFQ